LSRGYPVLLKTLFMARQSLKYSQGIEVFSLMLWRAGRRKNPGLEAWQEDPLLKSP
jgi:hypothetical protein